ncbi:MAG: BACON domain-containing protein, partial [Phycisphaerales bacterium]
CVVTSISSESASFGLAGGNGAFDLATNGAECGWTAASDAFWLSITSGASGTGLEGTITYAVAPNASADPRSGTITVGGLAHTVSQSASPCVILGFTPQSLSMPASGGTGQTSISTNGDSCSWSAISSAGWLTIVSGAEGAGPGGTIEFQVAVNTVATPRTATITAGGATFILTQAAAPCQVSSIDPAIANFAPEGGSGTVSLATNGPNCSWSAVSDSPWLVVTSGSTGSGTAGFVQYFVTPNVVAAERSGTITIGGLVHTVVQQGPPCEVSSVDPGATNFPSSGGTGTFVVQTNGPECGYAVASEAPWVVIVAGGSGVGAGAVEFLVLANAQAEAREASIVVGGVSHLVLQEAAPCVVAGITPSEMSIGADGGGGMFAVKVNGPDCPWSATTTAPWIELIDSKGTGGGNVEFEVASNLSTFERSGVIEVGDATFLLTQAGQPCAVVVLDPVKTSFPSDGGVGSFSLTTNGANCSWSAESTVPWIQLAVGSGAGEQGVVEYVGLANDGVSQRLGSIEVGGQTHSVSQAGGDDCNANGIPDADEIASGAAADCNENQIPDECDVASGTSSDFNGNAVPDECESDRIVGVPDEFPTIQSAIEAALPGWTIRVAPGLYAERIDYAGRALIIESITGPASTRIDGTGLGGTVVTMAFGEGMVGGATPVLRGF